MMIDHACRITGLVKGALGKLTSEPVGYAVSQTIGPALDPATGQGGLGPVWLVMVTVRSTLLGYPDVALALPVPGLLPADKDITDLTARLYRECVAARAKLIADAKAEIGLS